MSPHLPVVSGDQTVRALKDDGFAMVGVRGSHCKLRKADRTVIVPLHKELKRGTLTSILKQAGMTVDRFRDLL